MLQKLLKIYLYLSLELLLSRQRGFSRWQEKKIWILLIEYAEISEGIATKLESEYIHKYCIIFSQEIRQIAASDNGWIIRPR